MTHRVVALALALATAVGLAGCGAGAGDAPKTVKLTVTDGFGQEPMLERTGPEVRGGDTVMRLLQRNAKVTTRYGGGFVQSINEIEGGRSGARPVDWFFYVNGSLSEKGASSVKVNPGDRIWWDRHDWGAAMDPPAVVGSYPEPFVNGFGGERIPTRLECDESAGAACDAVQDELLRRGLTIGKSRPGTEGGGESLRVIVGLWAPIREDRALLDLEKGPKASGVYARVAEDGRSITPLDAQGRAAGTLGAGTGLVAATRWRDESPTWVVTGTDRAGLDAAARSFDERSLKNRFALAIRDDRGIDLPVRGGR